MANEKKEPLIPKGDRPGAVDLDKPLSQLKLRDLVAVLGSQTSITERFKPEHVKEFYKPEHFKEYWKPEYVKEFAKPEFIKPEILKEFSKPEFKGDPIDQIVEQLTATLNREQLGQLAGRLQKGLRGGGER